MTGSDATVFEFDVPARRPADTPRLLFKISGEPYTLVQPKLSVAVGLASLIDDSSAARLNAMHAGAQVTEALWGIVGYVVEVDPEPWKIPDPDWVPGEGESEDDHPRVANPDAGKLRGRARLIERLRDPEDGLDILDLAPIMERVVRALFDRPTGPSLASLAKQGDGGTDSAAGSSAPPASTPGT